MKIRSGEVEVTDAPPNPSVKHLRVETHKQHGMHMIEISMQHNNEERRSLLLCSSCCVLHGVKKQRT